jgi:hypothetical protein
MIWKMWKWKLLLLEFRVGSGAETGDTTLGTVDTIPGVVPEPAPPVVEPEPEPEPPVVPEISIDDVTVTEPSGDAPPATAVFTVTLSEPTTVDVQVNFTTADGTAISGGGVGENDYGSTSGTLTIPAGETSATIEVTVYGDNVDEATENYLVNLSDPVNATIADDQGIGTILDGDATPAVSIAVDQPEGVTEGATLNFTVTQDAISSADTTVTVNLFPGSALRELTIQTAVRTKL